MNSQRFFTGFGLLSVSLALHGTVFFSIDRAASIFQAHTIQEQRKAEREKDGRIQFEFVESPRQSAPKKPLHAKRISNRDALNQDLLKEKKETAVRPNMKLQGHADQLAQRQGSFAQRPSPQVTAKEASQAQKETPKPETEEKKEAPTPNIQTSETALTEITPRKPTNPTQPSEEKKAASQEQQPQSPAEAKQEVKGSGGIDKITTQEMSKIKSPGAQLFGQTSFEATGSGMGEYMKNLKEKIWLAWFPYLAYQYPQDFRGADVVVSLVLDAQGRVKIVTLLDSVGSPVFAAYCIEAIQRVSIFGPVPKEILELIGKDELELKFGFHYR